MKIFPRYTDGDGTLTMTSGMQEDAMKVTPCERECRLSTGKAKTWSMNIE
jgi:hypothetical protein